ncbi:hypothetical protein OHA70_15520 [Kribbella sp. NBC_00382]|uniref:hypothetical protein n=1 Tax=Kribbella sp. NBC_00382 TaxID=2975967 RepID=UPI002E23CE14
MVAEVVPSMTVNSHVRSATGLGHKVWSAAEGSGKPWVTITVGDYSGGVTLFAHDLAVLTELADVIERARQDLAEELGLLPNGEPCSLVDAFGTIEWHEHDHLQCLEALVDEPIPFVPTEPAPELGTAWERHDDPTVEDNPLDDDDYDEPGDDEGSWTANRVLRAEGFI